MFGELPLSVFWIFLKSFLVTSAKSLPLPVAILLRNSLGFTQETVWHAPVLAAKASILVLRFIYLPKLVAGKQQTFPWIRKRVLKYQLVIPDMKYLQINVWIFVSNVEVVGRNKDGLICPLLECLPFTISYHLHFLRISKSRSMLHHGSVWRVQSSECYFMFTFTFFTFLLLLLLLLSLLLLFFFCFFWWSIKFPQHNINLPKTEIRD